MKTRLLAIFVLFALFITANAQVPGYVPQNVLVGWWPFNGNANDESVNGNHDINTGAVLTADRFASAGFVVIGVQMGCKKFHYWLWSLLISLLNLSERISRTDTKANRPNKSVSRNYEKQ